MSDLAISFQERLDEVEAYLDFLLSIEIQARSGPPRLVGAEHPISTQQQRILYSSVFLQLYNLVEATMSWCLDAVVEATKKDARWKPNDLCDSLRREWVRAMARTHDDLTYEHRLDSALQLCDHVIRALPITVFEIDKGGGGNWDDIAIEAISRRLGFRLNVSPAAYSAVKRPFRDELGALALVKQLRNRLAHGAISFTQCAENVSVERLVELKNNTANYLREVVDCFSAFLNHSEYLLPERRPA